MTHECPFCGHPISKNWLFFGVPGGPDYICPHCHARLKMTWLRYLINFVIGGAGSGFLMYMGMSYGMDWRWFLIDLPIVALAFFLAIWFTPGQYRLEHEGYPNKKKTETVSKIQLGNK